MSAGLGTFANLMAKNNSSVPTTVEDEALAINALVLASHWSGAFNSGNGAASQHNEADYISEFLPWMMKRVETFSPDETLGPDAYYLKTKKKTCAQMNPFLVEFFALALLPHLGIRTAAARISSVAEAQKLGQRFIVKVLNRNPMLVLRWVPSMVVPGLVNTRYCLVSEIVRDAATLSYISRYFAGADGKSFSPFES